MGVARATSVFLVQLLPAVVGEGLVGLRHAVRVLALAHGRATVLRGVHQLVRQAKSHGLLATVAGGLDHPAHRQCLAAGGPNFNRHLISGAADAPRLHFDHGLDVVERRRQYLDRLTALLAGLLGDAVERAVDDPLGGGLVAVLHDDVHELGEHLVVVLRVRENGTDWSLGTSGHGFLPLTSLLRTLGAVLGATLLALAHTRTIERAAHGVITHTRQ